MRAMRGAAAILLLALLAVALGAAATGIYLDVPYVRQPKNGCGAACLAMILEYWKVSDPGFGGGSVAPVAAIQRQLYSKTAHGIYARDMVSYLDHSGMRAVVFAGRWSDLEDHL